MSVNNHQQASTREEYKKAKHETELKTKTKKTVQEGEAAAAPQAHKRVRIRMIPIWLRFVILFVLIVVSVVVGAVVGYGVIGGGDVADVFKESTWSHIRDLVDKK
ncbi:DNA-directed RNA polymerase subunit beta [Neobacillus jeddahensis]|uniref:DNA-directed RNA polymerase subunit beta n=1 Tax=Neobacillus jeddahensis TaxID=1461580 RepID=UPI00058AC71E|nr:DNA-directed RNA polymerase subunit beta [Neobacillus jeddahensis]